MGKIEPVLSLKFMRNGQEQWSQAALGDILNGHKEKKNHCEGGQTLDQCPEKLWYLHPLGVFKTQMSTVLCSKI